MSGKEEILLRSLLDAPTAPGTLARAALVVARHASPHLDVDHYLQRLDQDSARLRARVPRDAPRTWVISRLNQFLFEEQGYRGNQEHYYDPRNSLLDQVIDRRLGIPITLSILYLELGWTLGLPLEGVAFPGHFMVRCPMERGVVILDPFNAGASLSTEGLRERLEQQDLAAQGPADIHEWLQPADRKAILVRLLRNLKRVYLDTSQLGEAIGVLGMLLAIEPGSAREMRERGQLFRRMECWGAAVADLEAALAAGTLTPEEAEDTRQTLVELRSRPRLLH